MKTKSIGIILIIIGIIMVLYNSFNFTTTEKVVDIGPIEINKEVNHPMAWSPIIGIVLAVGGVVLLVTGTTKKA
ncbi:drug/metabolite transporter (DMT)-like permease [Flavobacterium sp. CG_9.1]|uniref:DUF3185 domain-containing protein n=1 Tax=Flavobacterium xanthum TaxID=69322 RepID=A0A1M7GQ82_9FLAO|nr:MULTISPECIES: hypothetical protein [Flavobacterium]MBG6062616.1 drug/metabolite transporter (DMT)-like permease [Flavobacterium sp. CG_9.1]SHM18318.1 hypothetical protein SAMN05443669_102458 [Flavobacterium xanthum]